MQANPARTKCRAGSPRLTPAGDPSSSRHGDAHVPGKLTSSCGSARSLLAESGGPPGRGSTEPAHAIDPSALPVTWLEADSPSRRRRPQGSPSASLPNRVPSSSGSRCRRTSRWYRSDIRRTASTWSSPVSSHRARSRFGDEELQAYPPDAVIVLPAVVPPFRRANPVQPSPGLGDTMTLVFNTSGRPTIRRRSDGCIRAETAMHL
jgi:hypothetical protein